MNIEGSSVNNSSFSFPASEKKKRKKEKTEDSKPF